MAVRLEHVNKILIGTGILEFAGLLVTKSSGNNFLLNKSHLTTDTKSQQSLNYYSEMDILHWILLAMTECEVAQESVENKPLGDNLNRLAFAWCSTKSLLMAYQPAEPTSAVFPESRNDTTRSWTTNAL